MGRIDHDVRVGRVMDGGDLSMPDADCFVNHLYDRRQAIGCA